VPGPDLFLAVPLSSSLPLAGGVWAYGPTPGLELIPYFLGLLAWAGMAFVAILLAPISALLRRLRRRKGAPPAETKSVPMTESVQESPGEGRHDRV
jgi:hypothetical protein